MKNEYEINSSTLAVISLEKNLSKIIEKDDVFCVRKSSMEIIDLSCKYFGSSYNGRFEGTKELTGFNYKSPIIIEETNNIIFFPTSSPRVINCSWIAFNNLLNYEKNNQNKIKLIFSNGYSLDLDISFNIIENQILRSMKLDSVLRKRKKF